jgi:peptide/nickel transport system substrate-binding protein
MAWRSGHARSLLSGRTFAAPLALVLALAVTGQSTGQSTEPANRSTLRVALVEGRLPLLLGAYQSDPAVFGAARVMRCCLARTLMAYPGLPTLDGGTVLHPDLAVEPPTVSRDGLLWSFRLRPDVRYQPPFEDRTVIAADIIRAIERSVRISPELTDPGFAFERLEGAAPYARGEAPVISGLQSSDPLSLTFRLSGPDGNFGHQLSDPASAPIPAGAADGYDPVFPAPDPEAPVGGPVFFDAAPFAPRFVSSGPYMWESYPATIEAGRALLVRNPSWDPATDPLRRPIPERIEIVTVPTREEAFARVDDGTVDIVDQQADAEQVERYRRDPARAGQLHTGFIEAIAIVPMNLALPPFDDVAVRRAVNAVMDRAALMEAHLQGRSELPWQLGHLGQGRVAVHVMADNVSGGLLATYDPFPSPGGQGSVAAGRAEMARSRYDTDGDGLCDAAACHGVTVVAEFPAMGDILREGLAAVGIEAEVVPLSDDVDMSVPTNRTAMQSNWYNWVYGLHGDLDDLLRGGPAIEGGLNHSLVGATPQQLESWGYEVTEVPSVDGLLDRCQGESGHRRARCWAQLDQILSEEIVPWLPIYATAAAYVVSPRVRATYLDQSAFFDFPALERTEVADGASAD